MFQLNDKEYRNLEEQVQKNKEDIAYHMEITQVLADFGITVLGRVNSFDVIANIDEGENWGYGYLVGPENDPNGYVVYVWTRPNPDIGKETAYWLNIGKISIVGPQGPAGKSISNATLNNSNQLVLTFTDGSVLTIPKSLKGDKGDPGINGKTPSITATQETNGVRIKTYNGDGNLTNSVYIANGQPGQSIQGPQGIPGKGLNIRGTYTSTAQFPSASTAQMGDACILQTGGTTTLYMLTGTPGTPSTYAWAETSFGGGTEITVNGAVQSTWNADTKLDKITSGSSYRVYAITSAGTQTTVPYSQSNASTALVQRNANGQISVPETPTTDTHATSKSYVDNQISQVEGYVSTIDSRVTELENSGGGGGGGGAYGMPAEVLMVWTGTGIFEYQCPDPVDFYQVGVLVQWKAYNNSTWNTSFSILDTQTEAHEYFDFPVWDAGEWLTDRYWLGITTLGSGDITVAIENPMDYETNRQFKVTVFKLS